MSLGDLRIYLASHIERAELAQETIKELIAETESSPLVEDPGLA